MFCRIPYKLEFLKKIPDEGQFATIIKEIPTSFHKDTGINVLDRIFVYNEQIPFSLLRIFIVWHSRGKSYRNYDDIVKYLNDNLNYNIRKIENIWDSWYYNTIHIKLSYYYDCHIKGQPNKLYRVVDHEINIEKKDEAYLKQVYDIVSFEYGKLEEQNNVAPAIKGLLRDLIDALQIDGMEKREAMKYLLNNNVLKKEENLVLTNELGNNLKIKLPGYYYKLKPEYATVFEKE